MPSTCGNTWSVAHVSRRSQLSHIVTAASALLNWWVISAIISLVDGTYYTYGTTFCQMIKWMWHYFVILSGSGVSSWFPGPGFCHSIHGFRALYGTEVISQDRSYAALWTCKLVVSLELSKLQVNTCNERVSCFQIAINWVASPLQLDTPLAKPPKDARKVSAGTWISISQTTINTLCCWKLHEVFHKYL